MGVERMMGHVMVGLYFGGIVKHRSLGSHGLVVAVHWSGDAIVNLSSFTSQCLVST